jgi:hypothetical protein
MSQAPHKGAVVVDFDGTICEHRYPDFGEPIASVQEALQRLKQAGFWIIIHTMRTSSYYTVTGGYDPDVNSPQAIRTYLERHQIPFDEIWMHDKPLAMVYIDDRGLRLVGNRYKSNWQEIVDALAPHKTRPRSLWKRWWQRQS